MKHIVFFDLETTGTDTAKDRIVEISAMKLTPDLSTIIDSKVYLINPGIPIPKEASDVHGITDEKVAGKPPFAAFAKGLVGYLHGCDLGGYNIADFDIPLLAEELARAGVSWRPAADCRVIDAYKIFVDREPRTLTAAFKFYTGEDLQGAHAAEVDNVATVKVLKGQMARYDDLKEFNPDQLHAITIGKTKRVDLAGKIVLNDHGTPCFSFGKSKGKPVSQDKSFAEWMLKADFTSDTKAIIRQLLGLADSVAQVPSPNDQHRYGN